MTGESADPAVADWDLAMRGSTSAQLRKVEAELHDALRRASDLEQVREELRQAKFCNEGYLEDIQDLTSERDEARAEAAEMRTQLLRATERNEVLRQEITAVMRDLKRTENDLKARQVELSAAYRSLADVEAERDRLRNGLANATIARHAAEKELIELRGQTAEPDPTATKES